MLNSYLDKIQSTPTLTLAFKSIYGFGFNKNNIVWKEASHGQKLNGTFFPSLDMNTYTNFRKPADELDRITYVNKDRTRRQRNVTSVDNKKLMSILLNADPLRLHVTK